MNLQELYILLALAKAEKAQAMKPYSKRIKSIQSAIRNLESFNAESKKINEQLKDSEVRSVPVQQEDQE
jgi:nicotinic acid mononucleotide adenylyltransferase